MKITYCPFFWTTKKQKKNKNYTWDSIILPQRLKACSSWRSVTSQAKPPTNIRLSSFPDIVATSLFHCTIQFKQTTSTKIQKLETWRRKIKKEGPSKTKREEWKIRVIFGRERFGGEEQKWKFETLKSILVITVEIESVN